MEDSKYASRKFILFLITDLLFMGALTYCLVYNKDYVLTLTSAIISIICAYSGINLADNGTISSIINSFKGKVPSNKSSTEDVTSTIVTTAKTEETPSTKLPETKSALGGASEVEKSPEV